MHPIRDAIVILLAWWVATWAAFAHSQDTTTSLQGKWLLQDRAANTTVVAAYGPGGILAGGNTTTDLSQDDGPGTYLTRSLLLDGSADYIDFDDISIGANTGYTITGWYKSTSSTGVDLIVGNDDGNAGLGLLDATHAFIRLVDSTTGATPSYTRANGTWTHFAAGRSAAGVSFCFINGDPLSGTVTQAGAQVLARIGTYNTTAGCFDGRLADVRVYSRALTEADIEAVMAQKDLTFKPFIVVTE